MNYWTSKRKHLTIFALLLTPIVIIISLLIQLLMLGIVKQELNYNDLKQSLLALMKNYSLTLVITTLIIIIIYFFLAWLWITFHHKKGTYIKTAKTIEHGGAKWIIDEEHQINKSKLTKFNTTYPLAITNLIPGWVVRTKNINNNPIFNIRSQTQALCLGATGSGKTQKIIIPSAIYNSRLDYNHKPCMVFTDPKGELCEKLSQPLQLAGYEILVLNIREPKFSSGWNPLVMAYKYYYDAVTFRENNFKVITATDTEVLLMQLQDIKCYIHSIKSCTQCISHVTNNQQVQAYIFKDKHWLYDKGYMEKLIHSNVLELKASAYEEVEELIHTLFPIPKSDNPMWTQNAGRMTAGVIYALLEILDVNVNDLPLARFNLTTVAFLLANQENLVKWFTNLGLVKPTSKAFITAAPVVNSAEQTRQGAFSNIGPALKIFEDLGVQNITCNNDIDLFKFTEKPKALFLIIPDEKTNRHIIGSLFVSQLYKANVFIANEVGGKLPRQLQFYLDEFGNMPTIPNFASFITVARSRNMFFLLVLQDYKQLYDKYDQHNGMTIRSNCNLNIYIQTNDHDTADAYSKMIGDYTVISKSISETDKDGKKGGSSSQTGIPLIKASDLMRLKDPYGIVMYAKENPAKVYMEYAYNCPSFNLGTYNPIDKRTVNVIDFYQDHFFDLIKYDFQTKLKEKYVFENQELLDLQNNNLELYSENQEQLQQDEALIRDQIHQLEQSDVETLTTEERLKLGNLRSKLTNIKNKLNIFNQSE